MVMGKDKRDKRRDALIYTYIMNKGLLISVESIMLALPVPTLVKHVHRQSVRLYKLQLSTPLFR